MCPRLPPTFGPGTSIQASSRSSPTARCSRALLGSVPLCAGQANRLRAGRCVTTDPPSRDWNDDQVPRRRGWQLRVRRLAIAMCSRSRALCPSALDHRDPQGYGLPVGLYRPLRSRRKIEESRGIMGQYRITQCWRCRVRLHGRGSRWLCTPARLGDGRPTARGEKRQRSDARAANAVGCRRVRSG
jgi:hypothetical protein